MNLKLAKPFRSFLILFLFAPYLYGQQTPTIPVAGVEITKAIPASPNAVALGKYGSVPVGYFTGIPNISIPLYTIKSGDLSLPISISYHAGGIKVEEIASSVGLGWALNAGGVITRTMRGGPDELRFGYLDPNHYVLNINNALNNKSSTFTFNAAAILSNHFGEGSYDGESDIFNFNFGPYSGQFSFTENGTIMLSPQQNIHFEFPYVEYTQISSFTAITPDGVKWYFGGANATEYTQSLVTIPINTSWLLYKIVSPTGSEIDFTYKPEAFDQYQPGGIMYRLISGTGSTSQSGNNNGTSSAIHNMQLTGIKFENGNIQVFSNLNRLDINPSNIATGAKMIDSLSINSQGYTKLYHFYYTNNTTSRLRLDSLIGQLDPITGTNNYKKEKYSFVYNPDAWSPSNNFLFSQDWWGFYNGTNNQTLVPYAPDPLSSTGQLLPGAERNPNAQFIDRGMLTQINYPTGGYTQFTYEPNQEQGYDFGADPYTVNNHTTAFSNDPSSLYYNYDTNNNNPSNLLQVVSTSNPTSRLPVRITAYGLRIGNNPSSPANDYISASIYKMDANGNYTNGVYSITNTDTTIYLDQGYYQIRLIDNKNQSSFIKYSVAAYYTEKVPIPGFVGHIASGLRIAKMADYDGIRQTPYNVKTYKYLLGGGSSGFLNYQPNYSYNLASNTATGQNINFVRTAVSNYPLATQHGAVVGYFHVEEDFDTGGLNGKNDYYYSISGAEGVNGSGFPFAPPTTFEWHEGLLTQQTTSRSIGNGNFVPVQTKIQVYSSIKTAYGLNIKAGFNPYPYNYAPGANYLGKGLIVQPYYNATDYTYLSSDTTLVYNTLDPTKILKTWNNYQMDSVTYQLTRVQSLNSKNELITNTITYPTDYLTFGNPTKGLLVGIKNLNDAGIITYPIEEVTQKSNADGTNMRTVKAILTSYKATKPFRDTVYTFQNLLPSNNFTSFKTSGKMDTRYKPVISFDKYEAFGNIVQERKIGGPLVSYIWGYPSTIFPFNNTYPIAEVVNGDSLNVAYTNFESYNNTGYGNWTYNYAGILIDQTAPMGSQCYNLSGNAINKNGLNTSLTYIVSFWAKQNGISLAQIGGTITNQIVGATLNGWTYYEYQVKNAASINISGTGQIDELRLYLINAQMKTYTYTPLVGIASICDTKNQFTYYQYDIVGRLTDIKDKDGNIIKHFDYHYKGQ